jgi:type VI secretion system protein ImpL
MATLRSPHFQMLERIAREFDGPAFEVDAPDWVRVARQLVAIRPTGRKDGLLDAATRATGVINTAGKQIIDSAISAGVPRGKAVFTNYIEAAKAYETLYAQFGTIASEALDGPGKAQKLSADFHLFSVDPAVKESALHTAYASLEKLKAMMGGVKPDNQPAWDLATGPLNFILAYVEEASACMLQSAWDANVFFPTQGASSDADLSEQLYGAKGSVWTFANDTARPFLQRTATRYAPVQTRGIQLAFTPEFLAFVNDANAQRVAQAEALRQAEADQKRQQLVQQRQQLDRQRKQVDKQKREQALERRQQDVQKQLRGLEQAAAESKMAMELLRAAVYPVTISALPTGVNPEAKARPFQTTLTVQCAPNPTVLNNFNFPLNMTLNWSAATCGDTTLQVKVEDVTLERRYPGAQGFSRFVQDFFSGERVFSAAEFPAQQARLAALGITAIGVRYTFAGQEAVLRNAEQQAAFSQLDTQRQKERQRLEALRERVELEIQEEKRNDLAVKSTEISEDRNDVSRRIEELSAPAMMSEPSVPRKIVACWEAPVRRSPLVGQPTAAAMQRTAIQRAAQPAPVAVVVPAVARERPAAQQPATPVPGTPDGQAYWVQVGLFREDVVDALLKRLQAAQIEVRVSTVTLRDGSTYQQVRNGPHADIESARRTADRVDEVLRLKSLIMKRPLAGG